MEANKRRGGCKSFDQNYTMVIGFYAFSNAIIVKTKALEASQGPIPDLLAARGHSSWW